MTMKKHSRGVCAAVGKQVSSYRPDLKVGPQWGYCAVLRGVAGTGVWVGGIRAGLTWGEQRTEIGLEGCTDFSGGATAGSCVGRRSGVGRC